jgi:hypothetical protein
LLSKLAESVLNRPIEHSVSDLGYQSAYDGWINDGSDLDAFSCCRTECGCESLYLTGIEFNRRPHLCHDFALSISGKFRHTRSDCAEVLRLTCANYEVHRGDRHTRGMLAEDVVDNPLLALARDSRICKRFDELGVTAQALSSTEDFVRGASRIVLSASDAQQR